MKLPLIARTLRRSFAAVARSAAVILLASLASPTGAVAEVPFGQGVLWQVAKDDRPPSYVFGTIHLGGPRILDLAPPVRQAFDNARSASFELILDEDTSRRMAQASTFTGWRTLDDVLGPDLYAEVVRIAAPYGLTIHHLRRLKPWVVLLTLRRPSSATDGSLTEGPGLDQWLQHQAEQRATPIYALESVEEQIAVFGDLPEKTQRTLMRSWVVARARQAGHQRQDYDDMVSLYLKRDVGAILQTMYEDSDGLDPGLNRLLMDRLLTERNHVMVRRMAPRLAEGKAFIAVGAGHLPGEQGILSLLAQQGYSVTRVY
jgi:uncharacterized protein YbaP (TraB family)